MKKSQKILIIKTGYSEILDSDADSRKVSLGDVLRTTPLLHLYKQDEVTWVTDEYAFPLLEGNPYIDRILPLDFWTAAKLQDEEFDTLINLEKNIEICKFVKEIDAWRKYGFRFDSETGKAEAYDRAFEVLGVSSDPLSKKENSRAIEELLFEMVGEKWNGERSILGYKPKTEEKYDVGLNTLVGQKWPTKSWPKENWDILEKKLMDEGYKVTRQDKQEKNVLTNLHNYIDWINLSNVIVTNDSLGLHVGLAVGKKVYGLFGPTPHKEVSFYGMGKAILPDRIPTCLPCFKGICETGENCMGEITPEKVYNEILNGETK